MSTETAEHEPDEADQADDEDQPAQEGEAGDVAEAGEAAVEQAGASIDGLDRAGRRRLWFGWLGGAGPVLALYTWVLTAGRADFLQRRFYDNFFDAQGRSFFDGHLDVPPEVALFEGFEIDGRTYIYFGPFPTLIRLPILALTDAYDGRLTTLSMLLAMMVLIVAAFRLSCVLRAAVRGSAPVSRREVWANAPLAVAVLAAPPFFLASATVVFHEASIWGVALTVAALDAVARWQRDPTDRRLAVAALLVCLALLNRQAIALGALVALALAGAVWLVRRYWQRDPEVGNGVGNAGDAEDAGPGERLRALAPAAGRIAAAVVLATVPAVAIHYAKFGQVFGVPIDKQVISQDLVDRGEDRAEVLASNPNFQGLEYVSTTAWQYFRPDAVDFRRDLPWIDFPRTGPTLVDEDVVFDTLDWSSSIPSTAPALTVLSLVALAWAVGSLRARRRGSSGSGSSGGDNGRRLAPRTPLSPFVVGTLVSTMGVLAFAYVAHRYLADIYPLVLVGGLIGFHVLVGSTPGWAPWARRSMVAAVGTLVAVGVVVNLALTLSYQRERGHSVPEEWMAEWVDWRVQLPGSPMVMHAESLINPPPVADGALLVVGDCEGLYTGMRDLWLVIEEAPDDTICRAVTR